MKFFKTRKPEENSDEDKKKADKKRRENAKGYKNFIVTFEVELFPPFCNMVTKFLSSKFGGF